MWHLMIFALALLSGQQVGLGPAGTAVPSQDSAARCLAAFTPCWVADACWVAEEAATSLIMFPGWGMRPLWLCANRALRYVAGLNAPCSCAPVIIVP